MKKIILFAIALIVPLGLFSQNKEPFDPDKKTDWWGDIDGYINQQDKVTLDMVTDELKKNPPTIVEPEIRKMALLMIDNVLHEEKAPQRPAVQEFFLRQIENAVEEIKTVKVEKGAVIWKLYNHTFIVKTPSVTIGFDIQRGTVGVENFRLKQELIQRLVGAVDILFISHNHDDHTDIMVAEMFIAQNKPVVSPPDVFAGLPVYKNIVHPERKANELQEVNLPSKGIKLKIITYPGHQGEKMLNNVYLVFTPEGLSFSHTGDQSNIADFEWIDRIGDNYKVDVLMTNSWAYYPDQRLPKGFRPGLIIPGHENELGHTIDHREPFWLNYVRLSGPLSFPWVQMAWGEKFQYIPVSK